MRDGVAVAVLAVAVVGAAAWFGTATMEAPPGQTPNASFAVSELDDDTLVVEHADGVPVSADSLRLLVYEDRRVLPDRTVHASRWGENGTVRPGDARRLRDRRFEPGQRLVVRWYGEDRQATLAERRL